jgi:hypothetical protein
MSNFQLCGRYDAIQWKKLDDTRQNDAIRLIIRQKLKAVRYIQREWRSRLYDDIYIGFNNGNFI